MAAPVLKDRLICGTLVVLQGIGISLIAVGVIMLTLQEDMQDFYVLTTATAMVIMGMLMLAVLYSTKHLFIKNRRPDRHVQIFTIERPSYFPPSYEESQANHVPPEAPLAPVGVVIEVQAPPLYSQDATEDPNCTWSWEAPPRYSQVKPV